eukprot:TRINITY_DN80358_c0_g1_i1.p1 TRINITY_DN80358_c0_g1~~TRINITY_DN80358_c0_g1_i1.p1  ORF type:complete len:467 (-),score=120.48 TRINITY_DN80358_c0_g1_i1:119-1519(-)
MHGMASSPSLLLDPTREASRVPRASLAAAVCGAGVIAATTSLLLQQSPSANGFVTAPSQRRHLRAAASEQLGRSLPQSEAPEISADLPSRTAPLCQLGVLAACAAFESRRRHKESQSATLASGRRDHGAVRVVAQRAQSDDDIVAEAKAAVEAAKLELEAAKLRAEVEEMERANAGERRQLRAKSYLGDAGYISMEALKQRIREAEGLEISEEQAKRIGLACGQSEVSTDSFRYNDLASEAFELCLNRIKEEEKVAKQAKIEAEARARADQQAQQMRDQANQPQGGQAQTTTVTGDAVENDDRGLLICLVSALCYILPLSDGLQFAVPLVQMYPAVALFIGPFALLTALIDSIPLGSFILFVIFILVAQQKQFPRLLRFSMEQAVLMQIATILPQGLHLLFEVAGGSGLSNFTDIISFFVIFGAVVYCMIVSSSGNYPDSLPVISNATKNVIDVGSFFPRNGNDRR